MTGTARIVVLYAVMAALIVAVGVVQSWTVGARPSSTSA